MADASQAVLVVDTRELTEATQRLKAACEGWLTAQVTIRSKGTGAVVKRFGLGKLFGKNPKLEDTFAAVAAVIRQLGGTVEPLAEPDGDSGGIIHALCGEMKRESGELDLVCGKTRGHDGPHGWEED